MATVDQWTGHEARLLRQSLRLSIRGFAEYLGVAPRTVSKWEAGGTELQPRPDYQAVLDTTLARATDEQQVRFAEMVGLHRSPTSRAHEAGPWHETSRSRDVLLSGAGLELPRLSVDQVRHLGETLDEARQCADDELAAYFGLRLSESQRRDGALGSVAALPSALNVIAAIEIGARRVSLPIRKQLLCLASRGAEFAGWLYRDGGDVGQATYWYDRAAEWAQEAGDAPLQGYVLLRRSQMAYDGRDWLRTLTLAQAAQQGPWRLPVRMRAEVTQQEALGLAMAGEPAAVVLAKLDDARSLLDTSASGDESGSLPGSSFTDVTLDLRVSVCYTELGWASRAAELLAGVLATGSLSRRDAGFVQARQGVALALCGEPDEAARVGLASVNAASEMKSQRTWRVLGEVAQRLAPWESRPIVHEFRELVAG